jgi:hypothetical protein
MVLPFPLLPSCVVHEQDTRRFRSPHFIRLVSVSYLHTLPLSLSPSPVTPFDPSPLQLACPAPSPCPRLLSTITVDQWIGCVHCALHTCGFCAPMCVPVCAPVCACVVCDAEQVGTAPDVQDALVLSVNEAHTLHVSLPRYGCRAAAAVAVCVFCMSLRWRGYPVISFLPPPSARITCLLTAAPAPSPPPPNHADALLALLG